MIKIYDKQDYTKIPDEVAKLCEFIAKLIGYNDYRAEAGIINYYHLNSTLSAHQDRSEYNMKAPLISLSFGNPAIFIIGDETKDSKPYALLIKSGDIIIMTNESRAAYHAVPRILKEESLNEKYFNYETDSFNSNENFPSSNVYVNDHEWSLFFQHININRINFTIRQVYD